MHTPRRPLALLVALAGLAVAAPANAADRTVTVTPAATVADWAGPTTNGLNVTFLVDGPGPTAGACGKDLQSYCDTTLVHVLADNVAEGSQIKFRIDGFSQASDFDLKVFASDETGAADGELGSPTGDSAADSPFNGTPAEGLDPRSTAAGDYETNIEDLGDARDPDTGAVDAYYLVQIPYFMVANDTYAGHATLIQPALG